MFAHYQVGRQFQVTATAAVEALSITHNAFIQSADRFTGLLVDVAESRAVVTTYRVLTSPTAKALYRFTGRLILAVGAAAMYGAFFAGVSFRRWCDALVERHLQPEAIEDAELDALVIEAFAPLPTEVEVDPWDLRVEPAEVEPVQPAAIAVAPVLLLPPAKEQPRKLDAYQLRDLCNLHGIQWRNAKGRNKHMPFAQMRQQLAAKGVVVA